MREGWLIDGNDYWAWRFHRDDSAWARDPKVFIDRGRAMPDGPALLKERRHVPQEDAETIWRNLKSVGWRGAEQAEKRREWLERWLRGYAKTA